MGEPRSDTSSARYAIVRAIKVELLEWRRPTGLDAGGFLCTGEDKDVVGHPMVGGVVLLRGDRIDQECLETFELREYASRLQAGLKRVTSEWEEHPEDWDLPCDCATCRSYGEPE